MGGYVLHALLDYYPEKVSAAMFIVTRSVDDLPDGKKVRTFLAESVINGDVRDVADYFEPALFCSRTLNEKPQLVGTVKEWMESTSPQAIIGALIGMRDRKNYLSQLGQFRVPSLVIGGELDTCISPDHAKETAKCLPRAKLKIIHGAGHMANMEESLEFNNVLYEFLCSIK